jgi:F1F0 ATPase subunit 2
MNEIFKLVFSLGAGILVGVIFFGGLWFTVTKVVSSGKASLWLVISWLIRNGIVLTGFYFVSNGQWEKLLVCLFGFLVARVVIMRYIKQMPVNKIYPSIKSQQ